MTYKPYRKWGNAPREVIRKQLTWELHEKKADLVTYELALYKHNDTLSPLDAWKCQELAKDAIRDILGEAARFGFTEEDLAWKKK